MKTYKYRGYEFWATRTQTEVLYEDSHGYHTRRLRPVYEISGLKDACEHPFLTSIDECKEYIDLVLWEREELKG